MNKQTVTDQDDVNNPEQNKGLTEAGSDSLKLDKIGNVNTSAIVINGENTSKDTASNDRVNGPALCDEQTAMEVE